MNRLWRNRPGPLEGRPGRQETKEVVDLCLGVPQVLLMYVTGSKVNQKQSSPALEVPIYRVIVVHVANFLDNLKW